MVWRRIRSAGAIMAAVMVGLATTVTHIGADDDADDWEDDAFDPD